MIFAVLATGPSMSQAVADSVRHLRCVAVSNAYQLAPWAEAMVSVDIAWWKHHPEALAFPGRKFCVGQVEGTEQYKIPGGSNSGLYGLHVAHMLGATRILLLGFDMHGTHYFGPHPKKRVENAGHYELKNTPPHRFEVFKRQFAYWKRCEVINCTPGSALDCYPKMDLADALRLAEPALRGP